MDNLVPLIIFIVVGFVFFSISAYFYNRKKKKHLAWIYAREKEGKQVSDELKQSLLSSGSFFGMLFASGVVICFFGAIYNLARMIS